MFVFSASSPSVLALDQKWDYASQHDEESGALRLNTQTAWNGPPALALHNITANESHTQPPLLYNTTVKHVK